MYIFFKKRQFLRHVLREVPIFKFSGAFYPKESFTKFMGKITGCSRRCLAATTNCQSSQFLTGSLGLGLRYESVSLEKKTNYLFKKSSLGTALKMNQHLSLKQKRNKIKMNASKIVNNLDKLISIEYSLDDYHRSNQDTCLVHKPSVFDGQWVQSGDLLADCSASVGGELALGQNILIAYMPWEGYNFEDAILVSERLVYDDLYTSVHIERYEVELRETKLGLEEITRQIPDVEESSLKHLNNFGIAKLGSWVEEGDILVGKVTPVNKKIQSNYQKLLYTILDKTALPIRDSSLRAPKGIKAKVIGVQIFSSSSIRSNRLTVQPTVKGTRTKQDDQGFSNIREDKSQESAIKTAAKLTALKTSTKRNDWLSSPVSRSFILNESKNMVKGSRVGSETGKSLIKSLKFSKSNFLEKSEATDKPKQLPWGSPNSPELGCASAFQSVSPKVSLSSKKLGQIVPRKDATLNQSEIDSQTGMYLPGTSQVLKKLQISPCFNKNNSFFKFYSNKHEQSVGLIDLSSQNKFIIGHNKFKQFSWKKEKSALIILKEKLKNKRLNNKTNFNAPTAPNWAGSQSAMIKYHLYEHFGSFLINSYPDRLLKPMSENKYVDHQINLNTTDQATDSREVTSDNLYFLKNFGTDCQSGSLSGQNRQINGLSAKQKSIDSAGSKKKNKLVFKIQKFSWLSIINNNLTDVRNGYGTITPMPLKSKTALSSKFSTRQALVAVNPKGFQQSGGPSKRQLNNVSSIQIYLAEKRRIQVGDKMAGRHGNKGIISQILPIEDMPFLPDGKPLDMVLNPLGVPSRMNVGQIYECLLGLAGKHLGENFKVFPFDEMYGAEASRSFVYSKLYNARLKTGKQWLFNPNSPGKIRLYDGRTGETFDQAITVGYAYMLRLVHMVDDKIHARSTGPYSLVTQQPLRGRSKQGGQRLGEMEVWALEGYGAAFTLLEMLTIKSDDMTGRMTLWSNLILNKEISIGTPESFKVLICELQALCLDIGLFKVE
jgi:DNA-directed RNA polymerase beta subunit